MTFPRNALITGAVQAAVDVLVVTDCMFHGISVNYESSAPVFIQGKSLSFTTQAARCNFTRCTFSQCICVDSPNTDTAGAIKVEHINFSMKDSLIVGCFGSHCSVYVNWVDFAEIQNSVVTECSGEDFAFIYLQKDENGKTYQKFLVKLLNCTNNVLHGLTYFEENAYSEYCYFSIIKCDIAFSPKAEFHKSNFIGCEFKSLYGNYVECYFGDSSAGSFWGPLQNCTIYNKKAWRIGSYSPNINEEASIPMDIKKFDKFEIKLNSTVIKGDQNHSPAKISFLYDDILITDCIFTDISISYSVDTVILMQNSLIKKVIVEHSYFSNISTSSSSGIIYMSKHRSSLSMTFSQNYVHNSFNSLCLFLSIGPRVDKVYDTKPFVHVNCSSLSFDADYSSESLMKFPLNKIENLYTNITTNNVELTTYYRLVVGNTYDENPPAFNQSVKYCNFYNSSKLHFLSVYVYYKYEECTFINFFPNDGFTRVFEEIEQSKYPAFFNCAFLNSALPEEKELSNDNCFDVSCLPQPKNIDIWWATPIVETPKSKKLDKNMYILIGVLSGITAILIISVIVIIVQKMRIKIFEQRRKIEKDALVDFG